MVRRKRKVVWDIIALEQLREIYLYIRKESPQGALKVRNKITALVNEIPLNPEGYEPDRFKISNDGSYRALTVYHYRVSYRITARAINILQVRHTSREPLIS
jgi:plasmid stabilization system protein ParE